MQRIAIALVTLVGFAGAAFATPTLNTAPNANGRDGYSKVEATSYVASVSLINADEPFAP